MSTQETEAALRPQDYFPGAEGWIQPSSVDIEAHLKNLRSAPESAKGRDSLKWLAEAAWHSWYGRHESTWLKTLLAIDAQMIRCIEWCLEHDSRCAILISGALSRYWFLTNNFEIGLPLLKRALNGPYEISRDRARAMSGVVVSGLSLASKMPPEYVQLAADTVEMYRCADDIWGEALAIWHLGIAFCYASRPKSTMECYWKALSRFREIGDSVGQANVLLCIASLPYYETPLSMAHGPGDLDPLTECLELFDSIGNEWGQGVALTMLLSQRRNLSTSQRELVRTKLMQRARERWAAWDHAGAIEANRLAAELGNPDQKPRDPDWMTVNLN